jgi:hypothetical protein
MKWISLSSTFKINMQCSTNGLEFQIHLENNFNQLSGYLKISASVIGPGDEQVPLIDNHGIDHTEKEVMLLPPHISMIYYQMKFRLIKAQNFPKMDTFGT